MHFLKKLKTPEMFRSRCYHRILDFFSSSFGMVVFSLELLCIGSVDFVGLLLFLCLQRILFLEGPILIIDLLNVLECFNFFSSFCYIFRPIFLLTMCSFLLTSFLVRWNDFTALHSCPIMVFVYNYVNS